MTIQCYRLRVAYDGTAYHGWQEQQDAVTVIGALRCAFEKVFHQSVFILGASRTDAGVHAYDQVARCHTVVNIDAQQLCLVWNRVLPRDIVIRTVEKVDPLFHPWHDVAYKTYWYHVFPSKPFPWCANFGWSYPYPIDRDVLQQCLLLCIGTHDFRSFCTGDRYDTTVRAIDSISVESVLYMKALRISITGRKFMRYMIRRIIGSAVYAASHPGVGVASFQEVFFSRSPRHQFPTAPSRGLLLRKIMYSYDVHTAHTTYIRKEMI